MKLLGKIFLLLTVIEFSIQAQTVSGFIYDSESGESLIGANVFIPDLETGASTNLSGYYVITGVKPGTYEILISYVGYTTQNKKIIIKKDQELNLDIRLLPSAIKTDEVVVTDESDKLTVNLFNKPISKMELSGTEINKIPRLIEADLLRALQTTPGVATLNDFSSAIYVRGGTPDQNLFLVDGTDVYNPDHAFGIFSTFNTEAIKKVDFHKGGFSAEYGGRLSSLVNVINNDGNQKEFKGLINTSLIAASTNLQIPISEIGSVSISFRRTLLDVFLKNNKEVPDYYFYDGNVKAYFNLGKNDKLTLSVFKGKDDLNIGNKGKEKMPRFNYFWGNITSSLNWKHVFSPKLFSSIWITSSLFDSNFDLKAYGIEESNKIQDVSIKTTFEYFQSSNLHIKFGGELKILKQEFHQSNNTTSIINEYDGTMASAFVTAIWKPNVLTEIEMGIRTMYFNTDKKFFTYSPRFNIKYRLREDVNLKLAIGEFYQPLHRVDRFFFSSIWSLSNKHTPIASSDHYIAGIQKAFGEEYSVELEGYYKTYSDISRFNYFIANDAFPTSYENDVAIYKNLSSVFLTGKGRSYGIELLIRKNTGLINGWISATYGESKYQFDKLNNNQEFIPRHSRDLTVNTIINTNISKLWANIFGGSYDKNGSNWKLNVNFVYSTGQPLTTVSSSYYSQTLPDWGNNSGGPIPISYRQYPGEMNNYTLPAYIRLDLGISYESKLFGLDLETFFQVFNATGRKNVWFISYDELIEDGKRKQKIDTMYMLPMLPSFGFRLKF